MSNGTISEGDLAVLSPGPTDYLRGVSNVAGKPSRLFPISSLPVPAEWSGRITALEEGQIAGMLGFATKALMDADLAHAENTLALVTNDPTESNNRTYRKTGASGAGSWAAEVDRVASVSTRVTDTEKFTAYGLVPTVEYTSADPGYFSAVSGFTRSVVGDLVHFEPIGTVGAGYFSRSGYVIDPDTKPVVKYRIRRTRGTSPREYVLYVVDSLGTGHYYGRRGTSQDALRDSGEWETYEVNLSRKPDGSSWGTLTIAQLWVSLSWGNGDAAWDLDYLVVGVPYGIEKAPPPAAWREPGVLGLEKLRDDLYSPLKSVTIQLIGDSITWGAGATGAADDGSGKNNLTSPTWANLLHEWLGESFADGVLIPASGVAEYRNTAFVPFGNIIDKAAPDVFRLRDPSTGERITPATGFNGSYVMDYALSFKGGTSPFNENAPVEFDLVGDNLTVVYSPRNSSDAAGSIVELWGNGVKLGEFNYYAATAYGVKHTFTFGMGAYKMRLVNKSATNTFVLEGFEFNKCVKVINDGISATSSGAWLEGGANLTAALAKYSDYVFVQLGTNDRAGSAFLTYFNLTRISRELAANNRKVVLMAANAVVGDYPTAPYKFGQRDVAKLTREVAAEQGMSFIDNHQPTTLQKIYGETWTSDGLHPNDAGHRVMFENIRAAILGGKG